MAPSLRYRKGGDSTSSVVRQEEKGERHDDGDVVVVTSRIPRQASLITLKKRSNISDQLVITHDNIDSFLAALGAGGSIAFLQYLTDVYEVPMMASFLISSAVKFFFNRTGPPTLLAFWHSTVFGIVAGSFVHYTKEWLFTNDYAKCFLVMAMMFYWKQTGHLWSAANNLAMFVAVGSGDWKTTNSGDDFPYKYILTAYVLGHLIIYAVARVFAVIRQYVRVRILRREFFRCDWNGVSSLRGEQRYQRLRHLFNRMDLSGDGRLDSYEFQLALRTVTGCDITYDESNAVLRLVDIDGTGSLTFDQFCAGLDRLARCK